MHLPPGLSTTTFDLVKSCSSFTLLHAYREGIRVHVIGDPSTWPASLQEAVREAEEMTRDNSRFHLILATGYSGRWDIVQACRELAGKVQDKRLNPEDIDEEMLAGHLSTNDVL